MLRIWSPVGLILASLVLGGCSSPQPIDTTQWRPYRPAVQSAAPRRVDTARLPAGPAARVLAREAEDDVHTTGSAAQSREHRPWPRTGTPEWQQTEAEAAETERRVQDAIRNICRGC